MIHSTRSITLVLISAATVLGGYAAFDAAHRDLDDQWDNGYSTTQPYSGHSSSYSHNYYHHSSGSGYFGSSGSRGSSSAAHGTSRGGFGGHGHGGS